MEKYLLLFILSCCGNFTICNAQTITVRGRVTDRKTGEVLSDANIGDLMSRTGVAANTYGLYSIRIKGGRCVLRCSMLGYVTQMDTLTLTANSVHNFALMPDNYQLSDVEVMGNQKAGGQLTLNQKDIQALPTLGSEPDVLKSLQYLPGVISGNEGSNNISVRGSNQWGNLILLDEAMVYNPNHALSFFSVFNNDAIQQVSLYKSYFPLKYGGRTSSVIDVKMREGNNQEKHRSATIGVIASKIQLEGPIKKGKTSYLIAGRFAYPGAVLNVLKQFRGTKMSFYDVNAKINSTLNDRTRIFFSVYNGGDHTFFNQLVRGYGMNWGNTTATFRWNRVWTDQLSGNFSAIFSNYYYRYKSITDGMKFLWKSNIQSYQLKYDADYAVNNALHIRSGLSAHVFTTMPGSISSWGDFSNVVPYRMDRRSLLDMAAYGEATYKISSAWQLNGGIRLPVFYTPKVGELKQKCYIIPEPRAELFYFPGTGNRLHAAFTQSSQNLHMLSNSSVGIPSDMWIPANGQLKPAVMKQVALGYERSLAKGMYTLSLETYYRKTNHIVDFVDNANIFLNNQIETQLTTGYSKAYGAEFYISKNSGRLTGWISYTFSRARNYIATLGDKEYPPVYDRPHSLKIFLNYEAGRKRRCAFAATFSYNSGMNLTLPIAHYRVNGTAFYIYSTRNGYRAPAFHELNLSMTCKTGKRGRLILSVMNVYNRKNVFTIYTSRDDYDFSDIGMHKMYLYGALPSISYQFTF